jgi:hypothetical protein
MRRSRSSWVSNRFVCRPEKWAKLVDAQTTRWCRPRLLWLPDRAPSLLLLSKQKARCRDGHSHTWGGHPRGVPPGTPVQVRTSRSAPLRQARSAPERASRPRDARRLEGTEGTAADPEAVAHRVFAADAVGRHAAGDMVPRPGPPGGQPDELAPWIRIITNGGELGCPRRSEDRVCRAEVELQATRPRDVLRRAVDPARVR